MAGRDCSHWQILLQSPNSQKSLQGTACILAIVLVLVTVNVMTTALGVCVIGKVQVQAVFTASGTRLRRIRAGWARDPHRGGGTGVRVELQLAESSGHRAPESNAAQHGGPIEEAEGSLEGQFLAQFLAQLTIAQDVRLREGARQCRTIATPVVALILILFSLQALKHIRDLAPLSDALLVGAKSAHVQDLRIALESSQRSNCPLTIRLHFSHFKPSLVLISSRHLGMRTRAGMLLLFLELGWPLLDRSRSTGDGGAATAAASTAHQVAKLRGCRWWRCLLGCLVEITLTGPDLLLQGGEHVSGFADRRTDITIVRIRVLLLASLHVLTDTFLAVLLRQFFKGFRLSPEGLEYFGVK